MGTHDFDFRLMLPKRKSLRVEIHKLWKLCSLCISHLPTYACLL